ncbi:hypothetical protein PQ469_16770 [Mucilaginibacter sp. KACC 22773]|jgi:hypothetical protein|uniref:hypothetical protein n=1 Tax=Mucilaginibacter sp. KACC 22773 TaxID=3025671 RepID=UPI002366889A|nr:hypothetical protein [Mucilaginibacter sp. KACC 22773]WDF75545.1 hypothetical protein PQ469_16770 [Mucilaginibacter sp. KACC 22773]
MDLNLNTKRLEFRKDGLKIDHIINVSTADAALRLAAITKGDMPAMTVNAIGSLKAINTEFHYMGA